MTSKVQDLLEEIDERKTALREEIAIKHAIIETLDEMSTRFRLATNMMAQDGRDPSNFGLESFQADLLAILADGGFVTNRPPDQHAEYIRSMLQLLLERNRERNDASDILVKHGHLGGLVAAAHRLVELEMERKP